MEGLQEKGGAGAVDAAFALYSLPEAICADLWKWIGEAKERCAVDQKPRFRHVANPEINNSGKRHLGATVICLPSGPVLEREEVEAWGRTGRIQMGAREWVTLVARAGSEDVVEEFAYSR